MPELLAPAGDWDCVKAAVENGADAIYFGLNRFNARMRAENFSEADLPRLMAFLHRRGVRGYLTFNTLVFTNELPEAERFLRGVIAAGVDAAIVQDVGICRLIRRLSPDFPIHASTQMTITSAAGVTFARGLGCQLVVLARECTLRDLEAIQRESGRTLPLEVFVHGALCVAYSGQCLTSESLGGRSANRGECAQACRLPYELVSDGQTIALGDRRYLLSPQDLASVELLPELARLGIASLKIEGRLKSPEYVASITRIYRRALDEVKAGGVCPPLPEDEKPVPHDGGQTLPAPKTMGGCLGPTTIRGDLEPGRASLPASRVMVDGTAARQEPRPTEPRFMESAESAIPDPQYEMQMAFSRGLHTGWFRGINNQQLVHARFPKKRGVFLGTVLGVTRDGARVRLEGPLRPGDGVVFDAGRPDQREEGGRVYEVRSSKFEVRSSKFEVGSSKLNVGEPRGRARPGEEASPDPEPGGEVREVLLTFGRGDVDWRRVHPGDRLWKTSDPALERELRATFAGDQIRFRRPLALEVSGAAGRPLRLVARDPDGPVVAACSSMALVAATGHPLTTERLREQLGRLGGTPFRLATLENALQGEVVLPVSELNRLRREFVAGLEQARTAPRGWTLVEAVEPVEPVGTPQPPAAPGPPRLFVLVRQLAQLEAALASGLDTVYCELDDPKRYREAVRLAHGSASRTATIFVAPPRITKPGEEWILKQVRSAEADGYLVRNYDHLEYFAGCRCVGDYTLNVANPLAAEYFRSRYHLERLTASYDLNGAQLEALLTAAPPAWFEITIHQHMPMFHMEHCVFCAFLSSGTDYTNCGRPCDRHAAQLRDRVGALHPLKADAGCRNTVFNALAQTGAEYVDRFLALGVRQFRIEFLEEPAEMVTRTIRMYERLLAGEITGRTLWGELRLRHQLGVTRGALDRGERPVTVL